MSGFTAWLAWLFIHILYLAQFENRVLVVWQWFWNYFTRNRTARLITGVTRGQPSVSSLEAGVHAVARPGMRPGGAG
jgi:hypothetical protein